METSATEQSREAQVYDIPAGQRLTRVLEQRIHIDHLGEKPAEEPRIASPSVRDLRPADLCEPRDPRPVIVRDPRDRRPVVLRDPGDPRPVVLRDLRNLPPQQSAMGTYNGATLRQTD